MFGMSRRILSEIIGLRKDVKEIKDLLSVDVKPKTSAPNPKYGDYRDPESGLYGRRMSVKTEKEE